MFRLTMVSLIFILVLSSTFLAGFSGAWFTSAGTLHNRFTVEIPEPQTESAWTSGDFSFGNPLQWYFIYNEGDGSTSEPVDRYIIFIGASQQDVIGRVSVWDENGNLYIRYHIDIAGVTIETASLYAESTAPTFSGAGGYNTAKAVYAWPGVLSHTFELSFTESPIYIAGKLDVFDNR